MKLRNEEGFYAFKLQSGKKILFLTKELDLLKQQLNGTLDLQMKSLSPNELQDDINTDMMTPAWVCFDYLPTEIAKNAYAGMLKEGKRVVETDALKNGNFEGIVSHRQKGVGSSRETAVQAELYSGIQLAVAASFAPIHARNNINLGVLMTSDYKIVERLQAGETIPIEEFCKEYDPITRKIVQMGGIFTFSKAVLEQKITLPPIQTPARPMTIAEKIIVSHALVQNDQPTLRYVKPGDALLVRVDGGYSHEFTTAQVHQFLKEEVGENFQIKNPERFACFEDHLVYANSVTTFSKFISKIQVLRDKQAEFSRCANIPIYAAVDGKSPGICHEIAREKMVLPGDIIQATDSHTCMGGANGALAFGVGATEYANILFSQFAFIHVPESIRFEFVGKLAENVTAKDVMLTILDIQANSELTLDRVMEFGGPGMATLSMDERATLANMATEASAKAGIVEFDEIAIQWILERHPELTRAQLEKRLVKPDPKAHYAGGVHPIDLSQIQPMLATPGDPVKGIPSDPKNGLKVSDLPHPVPIHIAYAGSCTAGKRADMDMYARVLKEAVQEKLSVATGVQFFIQFGSQDVENYARKKGYLDIFQKVGAQIIAPGCGACIGCGPGVSTHSEMITISAINRNYKGRSGPGEMYLASPLTVAASAICGKIVAYSPGMFSKIKNYA
ncbi:MAG: aconitase family protein [Planctomycetota bacterium]